MIKSNRLFSIVELIDKNNEILLDIGTDHGYIIKKAFEANKTKYAIAADVNKLPLKSAKENLVNYPVEFVISDGFKNIDKKYDTVVIAGLGSNLIIDILSNEKNHNLNTTYILQGNNNVHKLRKYLNDNNFKIIDEVLVYENEIYYVVIKAIKGKMDLTDKEIYLGPILKEIDEYKVYYLSLLNHIMYQADKNKIILEVFKKEIAMLKSQLS